MSIVNWSPIVGIDDYLNRSFGGFRRGPDSADIPSMTRAEKTWQPAADISETDREYLIRAQLPGVDKESVDVSFEKGVLTIEGERKATKSSDEEKMRRSETFYGKYYRSFSLPDNIDEEQINAQSKDGVLTIRLPKSSQKVSSPKSIRID